MFDFFFFRKFANRYDFLNGEVYKDASVLFPNSDINKRCVVVSQGKPRKAHCNLTNRFICKKGPSSCGP